MAENKEQPESEPPLLDYREGAADQRDVSGTQFFGGMVSSAVLLMGAVFVAIVASIPVVPPTRKSTPYLGFAIVGIPLVALNIWAILVYRRGKRRSFAIGLWVGIGVAALFEGICFAANFR